METPVFFSVETLAAYLQVPEATLYQWRHRQVGPRGIKVGRHVRYRCSDVEAWLERNADDRKAG